jgi:competence protein ComEA
MTAPADHDWTRGAAKWAAVAVLGGASIFGMAWSIARPPPPPRAVPQSPPATFGDPAASPAPSQPPTLTRTINLNTATAAELELLPGIGPALAARIIEYRRESGGFRSVDELDKVKGIGPRTLEKVRHLVSVD